MELTAPTLPSGTMGRALSAADSSSSQREDLRTVAQKFEAMMLRQILSTARAANFGGDEIFGGQGLKQFQAMRDEHLADIASQQGSFGFARAIETQLAARVDGGS